MKEEKKEKAKTEQPGTANLQTKEKEKTEKVETTATASEQKKEESLLNKWLSPVVGYSAFFGALAVAIGIGLLVCLL